MTDSPGSPLSTREVEVLQLVARGHDSAEIGRLLSISKATVRTHVNNIFKKANVHSRAEAVAYGIRKRLIKT
jgi:DNA-binding CsgD family transcriptional regulator